MYKPLDAVVALTYHCNARCVMCNIWRKKDHQMLDAEIYQKLSPSLRYINLTGGEPFLRSDLLEIYKRIQAAAPQAQIIFSTNGLLTDHILEILKKIMVLNHKVGVRVSIDGIGDFHSSLRGIPRAFEKATATLEGLKQIGVKNLGIGHTLMDANTSETPKVYRLAKELGVEFSLALAQNSEHYFEKLDNKIEKIDELKQNLEFLVRHELKSFAPKRWGRAFFEYGAYQFVAKNKRVLPDGAGIDSCFISPKGDVYPSDYINEIMGNLKENTLDAIWRSEKASAIRDRIKREKPIDAWMICTLRGSFVKNRWKVLGWAIKNKLKLYSGRPILE